jgi:hypothetical protein
MNSHRLMASPAPRTNSSINRISHFGFTIVRFVTPKPADLMFPLGQERTLRRIRPMSALALRADVAWTDRYVRTCQKDSCSAANSAAIVLGSVEVQVVLMARHCRIGDPRVTRQGPDSVVHVLQKRLQHERSGPVISRASIGPVEVPRAAPATGYFAATRSRYQTELSFHRENRLRLRSNFAPRYAPASPPRLAWVGRVH